MEAQQTGITIAVDGYSSCGKSTLAKDLAKALAYRYIDSGAMYRAVTLYFLQHHIDIKNEQQILLALENIYIDFKNLEGVNTTFLNGERVEHLIRNMEVSNMVSPVAALSVVRKALVARQQLLGRDKEIVMDGRDIGTVVFPKAELKIFLNASPQIRAQRRYDELKNKGENPTMEEIKKNLETRDRIDTNREDSPLRQADDAVYIDNSNLTRKEQLAMTLALAHLRMNIPVLQR